MANTTQTLATWGVTDSPEELSGANKGIVTSLEVSEEMMSGQEQNEIGAVIAQHVYDSRKTVSAGIMAAASANPPEIGETITIGGKKFYVTGSTVSESNNDFRKFRVTAERYRLCDEIKDVRDTEKS